MRSRATWGKTVVSAIQDDHIRLKMASAPDEKRTFHPTWVSLYDTGMGRKETRRNPCKANDAIGTGDRPDHRGPNRYVNCV
jgi:hypothetical protein